MSRVSKSDEESVLSLAYRGLTELPRECIPKLAKVRHLDLSNNNFSYPLNHTPCMTVLMYEVVSCPAFLATRTSFLVIYLFL